MPPRLNICLTVQWQAADAWASAFRPLLNS